MSMIPLNSSSPNGNDVFNYRNRFERFRGLEEEKNRLFEVGSLRGFFGAMASMLLEILMHCNY